MNEKESETGEKWAIKWNLSCHLSFHVNLKSAKFNFSDALFQWNICLTLLWLWEFLDDLSPFNQQTARLYKRRKLHSIYISSELLNGKLFEMENSLRAIRCERWCVKDLKSFLIYFIIQKLYKHERTSSSFVWNELSFPPEVTYFLRSMIRVAFEDVLNRENEWNSMQISRRFFIIQSSAKLKIEPNATKDVLHNHWRWCWTR